MSTAVKTAACLIVWEQATDECLFFERPDGSFAFGGGKTEDTDISALETALRECREELGLKVADVNKVVEIGTVQIGKFTTTYFGMCKSNVAELTGGEKNGVWKNSKCMETSPFAEFDISMFEKFKQMNVL